MGGLIKNRTSTGDSGIPLLKDIPIIGKAFSSTEQSKDRTELLLVMTPRVVRNDIDIREVSDELRDRLRGLSDDELLQHGSVRPQAAVPSTVVQPLSTP